MARQEEEMSKSRSLENDIDYLKIDRSRSMVVNYESSKDTKVSDGLVTGIHRGYTAPGQNCQIKRHSKRAQSQLNQSHLAVGVFLVFFSIVLLSLSVTCFYAEHWGGVLSQLFSAGFFALLGWFFIRQTQQKMLVPAAAKLGGGGESNGMEDAGELVPIKPPPTHHLVAMKDLPPQRRTHLLPKD